MKNEAYEKANKTSETKISRKELENQTLHGTKEWSM